ncbi:MAG TPA: hypothetical protein VI455_07550, partial [Terriglobia bacterium]
EVRLGGWWILGGDPGVVFDPYPDSTWSRLIARTERQMIENMPPGEGSFPRWSPVPLDLRFFAYAVGTVEPGLRNVDWSRRPVPGPESSL